MVSSYIGNSLLPFPPAGFPDFANISWQGGALDTGPIPAMRWSDYKAFERAGSRQFDKPRHNVALRLDQAACALLMGDDSRLDELHDLIWAICEQSNWWLAAHSGTAPIDLCVAMTGEAFALIEAAFGPRLDPEVRARMVREAQARVIEPFLNPPVKYWWAGSTNNWNAVCSAGIGISALAFEKDAARLDAVFAKIFDGLPRFLDGFTEDGGCAEGPGYWSYGMSHFAALACALRHFTRGEVDIAADPKWKRVAAYPLAVAAAPHHSLAFSDCHDVRAPMPLSIAEMMRALTGGAGLFARCEFRDGKPVASRFIDLLMAPASVPDFDPDAWRADSHLPDLAIAKLGGAGGFVLGAKAGHNNEHHNHNDVGAFLLFQDGAQWLADPGAPIYSANTFNERRYESLFTSSRGHCVPVIDGRYQSAGEQFRGTLAVSESGGFKRAAIEFAGAYDIPELAVLAREIAVSTTEPEMALRDHFQFNNGVGLPVREAFITSLPTEQLSETEVALTHPSGRRGILRALASGAFSIEELREESKESPAGILFRRILFTPSQTASEQTLSFCFRAMRNG